MPEAEIVRVTEESQVGDARRRAEAMARRMDWPSTLTGNLAIAVTEAATNLVKHGKEGEIHLQNCGLRWGDGIEVLAFDRGPGMRDVDACLRDGFSGAGTAGTGLGAIERLATEFDIHSMEGKGTALVARFYLPGVSPARLMIGAVQVPVRGEVECGDSWGVRIEADSAVVMVADGLGHGAGAASASRLAVRVLAEAEELAPVVLLGAVHRALRGTRGAAVAIARIDFAAGEILFAGVGNVNCVVHTGAESQHLVSHNGTAGDNLRKVQEFRYPWSPGSRLSMHSDGLSSNWNLNTYPGLASRDPALIAAVLYRDAGRVRDDACVVVARARE